MNLMYKLRTAAASTAIVIILSVSYVLGDVKAYAQSTENNNTDIFQVPDLNNLTHDQLENSAYLLENARSKVTDNLVDQLDRGLNDDAKAEAIYMLGVWRDPDATKALLPYIDFVDKFSDPKDEMSYRGGYVARAALIKIGHPAANYIYIGLSGRLKPFPTIDDKSADGFAEVLCGIEGPQNAALNVTNKIKSAPDAGTANNLRLVLKYIQSRITLQR